MLNKRQNNIEQLPSTTKFQVLSYKVKDSTNVEKDSDFQCYFQSLELTFLGWRATTWTSDPGVSEEELSISLLWFDGLDIFWNQVA